MALTKSNLIVSLAQSSWTFDVHVGGKYASDIPGFAVCVNKLRSDVLHSAYLAAYLFIRNIFLFI
jgi:hypothetical protein